MMPSFFIAHGAPTIVLENNGYTKFLKQLSTGIPKPKGIVIVTAHWESRIQQISNVEKFETIYDFSGFPDELYNIEYPARGDNQLAQNIGMLFDDEKIAYEMDSKRGLDHGSWAILKLVYPEANIPVVQLSVNSELPNERQYQIGRILSKLREEGNLIICSGGTTHNLMQLEYDSPHIHDWAIQFENWLKEKVVGWDVEALFRFEKIAPNAKNAVPTREHFIPLFIGMGTGDTKQKAKLLHHSFQHGNLSLSCWEF
ncbi:dioxygenase [Bacillus solimangrovi]|uniref:Dioxygenase n=2 Tax=Bacillus solimangrovi TaxID=1305675 RepID=A0A1E5LDC9_9BACI|nr:class III extradiol ring-cleavage dioxygenase [Bacillus solimangrovi]OEH92074.1 dioxygenase [Bacillus solimangrovi]